MSSLLVFSNSSHHHRPIWKQWIDMKHGQAGLFNGQEATASLWRLHYLCWVGICLDRHIFIFSCQRCEQSARLAKTFKWLKIYFNRRSQDIHNQPELMLCLQISTFLCQMTQSFIIEFPVKFYNQHWCQQIRIKCLFGLICAPLCNVFFISLGFFLRLIQ